VTENVRKYMEEGYRHVRAQMGGYGGGGMVPTGKGGSAFDEDVYLEVVPKLFEELRAKLGTDVKLLHDVHEHGRIIYKSAGICSTDRRASDRFRAMSCVASGRHHGGEEDRGFVRGFWSSHSMAGRRR
jgi:hypothetical protein